MAKDPVCGMEVNEKSAKYVSQYQGKAWYFCAAGCKKAFDENPEKYASEEGDDSGHVHHHHHHH